MMHKHIEIANMDCFVYKRILYIVGFLGITSIIHIIVYKEEISVKIFL